MKNVLSPLGDTTGNMYTDLGADTPEGFEISSRSRQMAREAIGDQSPEDRIRQRCSIAVGDFAMADLMRFSGDPVQAGLAALAARATVFTDIRMVQTGIQKRGHQSQVACVLDKVDTAGSESGKTRTSSAFLALETEIADAILVIGNAPSALLVICEMVQRGIRPALIIGTPVGFVNASESKELLRRLDIPSISNEGTRGGTPVAVAAINEIITMYAEQHS